MALTQAQLQQKLSDGGVAYEVFEHEAVMTVEAQAGVLTSQAGANADAIVKNLFLKDKRGRYIIISALANTKVDLKVLSARLGTGKGGIRMADPECVEQVLQVPLGSVTPLAIANSAAKDVTLLLDQKIEAQPKVYVHPLVNTASLAMAPAALAAAVKLLGKDAIFVDLEADPKIDRDHPPDLAKYLPEPPAPAPAPAGGAQAPTGAQAPAAAAAAPAPKAAAAAAKNGAAPAGKQGKDGAAAAAASTAAQHKALTDVSSRTDAVLQQVAQTLLGCKLEEAKTSDPAALARLRADVEMQLTALKNAAYASGYLAGKGEVVSFGQRLFV